MMAIETCPRCGSVAYPVFAETVENFAGDRANTNIDETWHACTKRECGVAYFSSHRLLETADIAARLWYKDLGGDVPICYCSKLTRDEILQAVMQGCDSIKKVRQKTGKNITGRCRRENPLSRCCEPVFIQTIREALGRHQEPKGDRAP